MKTMFKEGNISHLNDEEFLSKVKERNRLFMQDGVRDGLWSSFDEETNEPIDHWQTFKISDFPEKATLGHVMFEAKIFPSISNARKNGWNDPIREGEWIVTKKKIRIKVIP